MSFPILDYLPCNLTFYSQQVLPAWRAAHHGHFQPLRELMDSAHHFSCWPVFNIPNPFPDKFFAGPKSCFGWDYFRKDESIWPQLFSPHDFPATLREELLQEVEETNELNFWALCSRHLPTLFGNNAHTESQTFLLHCLFYTFCCQLPSEEMADCREIGNEDVDLWVEYMARNRDVQTLWDPFRQLSPQPLADQLLAPQTYQDYLALVQHNYRPRLRALFGYDFRITGFLDNQETVHLLAHLPTNERPELDAVISGCIRDREKEKWPLSPELEQLWRRMHYIWPEHESNMYELSVSPDREAFRAYMKRYREMQQRHYEEFLQNSIKDEQQIREIYRAFCAYWNEEYPQVFQKNVNRYYQNLERMETEMLSRFRYAAEHGWSMIEIWA